MSNETEKDYLDSVENIAKDAKDHEREGGDASDHIHESVDGSQWAIYTWRNEPDMDGPSNAERTERHAKGDMDR